MISPIQLATNLVIQPILLMSPTAEQVPAADNNGGYIKIGQDTCSGSVWLGLWKIET
jgi:hypothetical protein